VRALARIVAEADGRGGTRLAELYGEAPLLPRRTHSAGDRAEVYLVGGAAGPLGGDELRVEVHVGPWAALVVRTVAASVILPGSGPSHTLIQATVADGGRLDWLPEPIVAARGCDHHAESQVELGAKARLRWREELVCGRHDEECGDLVLSTAISQSGCPLYRQDLAVGPRTPGWDGPAGLGNARTCGTVVILGPDVSLAAATVEGGARMPLAVGGVVASAVALQAHELRRALDALTG
jgi:urease accessory protein